MKEEIKEELAELEKRGAWLVPRADEYLKWSVERIEQLEKALELAKEESRRGDAPNAIERMCSIINQALGKEE